VLGLGELHVFHLADVFGEGFDVLVVVVVAKEEFWADRI